MEARVQRLTEHFLKRFGANGRELFVYMAPGRVNIIGEHTDYNGGLVLPCALQFGTFLLIRLNDRRGVRMASLNFPFTAEIPLQETGKKIGSEWVNYPLGVFLQFQKHIKDLQGFDMLFEGDIPNEAGLSSSASIEMVTALAINDLFGLGWSMLDLIKASRRAENEFVGVNCGIMDQFAVGNGKANHAIFLNCDTLEHELVPFELKEYRCVIANTNKKRGLADSKYNERVEECNRAVGYLKRSIPVRNLGEVHPEDFEKYSMNIPDETIRKRARHVISENDRVILAVKAMRAGDMVRLGNLMNQSHHSLQHDYEVTGFELDTLVHEALLVPGVIGSRMTGAGFGGCTVSIVHQDSVSDFEKETGKQYQRKTGLVPVFYRGDIGDGVRRILP